MERYNNPFEYHDTDYYVACVGDNGGTDNFGIREGYKKSVYLLINAVKHGESEDHLIYPIVYNARHSIELSLKIIIENILCIYRLKNIRFDEIDKKKIYTHDIEVLDSIITKYYKVDNRIVEFYDKVLLHLKDYFFDVNGDAFKYEDDHKGNSHMITHNITSISIDILEEKFDKLMSIFDSLISELFYLCEEYKIGTFTKNLSREDLRKIALILPKRNKWSESYFTVAKYDIKAEYIIGSKEFTEALNIIQNHREFCVLIDMEKVFGDISEDELREYARLVILMGKYHKEHSSWEGSSEKTAKEFLWVIQDKAQKRKELAKNISDSTLSYLMTFREYGRNRCFSERLDDIFYIYRNLT
ncbi:hypothetical protein [Clostridium cochlearium]|uniref:hypothetical protein n=1 Tax=Clostridium cochlearium TaxID=1494 RepID=UPI000DF0F128|nr:hypothetical protein [Clostridium cochlearium]STA93104.1 Uncharacterised protein [Clostridium cochlearium]